MQQGVCQGWLCLKLNYCKIFLHKIITPCRSAYVEDIENMTRKIERQREELRSLAQNVRQSQKDINQLEGKLHRAYAELDSTLFQARAEIN